MKLYLVQHAKAFSEQQDPERPLTEEGRQDIEKVAAFIRPLNLSVGYLWHSGKKRAVQTAALLAEAMTTKKELTARNGLGPNDDVSVLKRELDATTDDIMLVGHLPFLGKLASLLLTGSESTDAAAFRNSGIVCLSCSDDGRWHIEWMVTPELLV